MKYKSYEELKDKILNESDTLIFTVDKENYEYGVSRSFLYSIGFCNDIIFRVLRILNPMSFCNNSYKYPAFDGYFPYCNDYDYKALTRVALNLFKLCDNYKSKEVEEIWH